MEQHFSAFNEGIQIGSINFLKTLADESMALSHTIHEKLHNNEPSAAELKTMKEEIDKLLKRREELKTKLKGEFSTVREIILSNLGESKSTYKQKTLRDISENAVDQIPKQAKKRKLGETKSAYMIAGNTLLYREDEQIALRFETFFNGKFYEHYYIFLDFDSNNERVLIHRHTIPFFIPLDDIQKKYLSTNLKLFMEKINEYLNSYTARREQVNQLAQCASPSLEVQNVKMSRAADHIVVKASHNDREILIKLMYNLLETYPKQVEVYRVDTDRKQWRIKHIEHFFTIYRLNSACEKAFP
jgi:hypothetical protein